MASIPLHVVMMNKHSFGAHFPTACQKRSSILTTLQTPWCTSSCTRADAAHLQRLYSHVCMLRSCINPQKILVSSRHSWQGLTTAAQTMKQLQCNFNNIKTYPVATRGPVIRTQSGKPTIWTCLAHSRNICPHL